MVSHLLEHLTAIPTHALMTAWGHGCVLRGSQTNDALLCLLLRLFNFKHFDDKLLLTQWDISIGLLSCEGTSSWSLAINESLLQLIVLILDIVGCYHYWSWSFQDLIFLLSFSPQPFLPLSLLELNFTSLHLCIHFQEKNQRVDSHDEQQEQRQRTNKLNCCLIQIVFAHTSALMFLLRFNKIVNHDVDVEAAND